MSALQMDEPTLAALADLVVAKLRAPAITSAILLTEDAIAHVKCGSDSSFSRWCKRWGVRNCGQGRWPLHRLNAGLEREAMQGGRKRKPEVAR